MELLRTLRLNRHCILSLFTIIRQSLFGAARLRSLRKQHCDSPPNSKNSRVGGSSHFDASAALMIAAVETPAHSVAERWSGPAPTTGGETGERKTVCAKIDKAISTRDTKYMTAYRSGIFGVASIRSMKGGKAWRKAGCQSAANTQPILSR
jgi:hypothetical protein